MPFDVERVREEIRHWFFDIYVPHGIRLFNGDDPAGPRGFLQYWGRPLLFTSESSGMARWLMTDEEVMGAVKRSDDLLKAAGYRDTPIPDRRVFVYNANGGAVEVIWSRQDGQGREIQRLAVHFAVARLDGVWRFVGIQSRITDRARDADMLDRAWNAPA